MPPPRSSFLYTPYSLSFSPSSLSLPSFAFLKSSSFCFTVAFPNSRNYCSVRSFSSIKTRRRTSTLNHSKPTLIQAHSSSFIPNYIHSNKLTLTFILHIHHVHVQLLAFVALFRIRHTIFPISRSFQSQSFGQTKAQLNTRQHLWRHQRLCLQPQ